MRATSLLRPLMVLLGAGLLIGVVGGSALATTDTGTQNPDLTVTVSLLNEGGGEDGDPDTATAGEDVTASGSVTNNTSRTQPTEVAVTLTDPSGDTDTISHKVPIKAGETKSLTYTYTVDSSDEKGAYELTVAASNRNGTSSATAEITVY